MSVFENMTELKKINISHLDQRQVRRFVDLFKVTFPKETAEIELFFKTTQNDLLGVMIEALWFVRQKTASEKANQELFAGLARVLGQRLQKSPKDHNLFDTDMMQTMDRWKPIQRVVVLNRANELKETKVLFRKGKYDLSGVRQTHYGKKVMETLGLRTRYILSKKEYYDFQIKTQAMGFELPQEIMPTEAENYFKIQEVELEDV
ncbi:MAG: hypothetical protein RTV41_01095 [Candidatus Thorarchaeota archaeon]